MYDHEPAVWHDEVIPDSTRSALISLRDSGLLDEFYLAGGTGLALQFGHRLSLDLDLFSSQLFDENALLARMQKLDNLSLTAVAPYTLHATLGDTKISFLGYAYPVLFTSHPFLNVSVADPRDVACMKLSAIASRGAKRDFIDLYVCANRYGLAEILALFDRKYVQTRVSKTHLLKSMTYFADAEKDPMPRMLAAIEWDQVKLFFRTQVPRLLL